MNKKQQRQHQLLGILQSQGLLPVRVLAGLLNVSEMTIRRDLDSLPHQLPYGQKAPTSSYSLMQAIKDANEQKERIGKFAASLLEPNDVAVVDTGSTTARMLPYLPTDKNLTILCYNANVLLELRHKPGIQLLFCGGAYHPNTEMFESPEGIQFIARTRANKVFLSAAGVHETLGLTCANQYEVPTKSAVIQSSFQRILLADSSKFGQLRSSYFCNLEDIHTVVTDKSLPQEWQQLIQSKKIKLYMV